jgi:hypothetical protein
MAPAKLRLAQAAMQKKDTTITALCEELGVTKHTLYRYVGSVHYWVRRHKGTQGDIADCVLVGFYWIFGVFGSPGRDGVSGG